MAAAPGSAGGRPPEWDPVDDVMKAMAHLVVGLAMLVVFVAAAFGLWSAVAPDTAKGARDRAIRAADRLTRDDQPAAEASVPARRLFGD